MSNNEQNTAQAEVEVKSETVEEQSASVDSPEVEIVTEQEARLEKELAAVKAQLEAVNKKVEDDKDAIIRAKAEVDNMRRRTAQDVDKAHKFALEKFAGELLPVADNLQRALEASDRENEALTPMIEGVELTLKSFDSVLGKFGIDLVAPEAGSPFNPEFHQAMAMVPNPEFAPNSVITCMQKGYTLNGRLLRPAMVMVSASASVDTQA